MPSPTARRCRLRPSLAAVVALATCTAATTPPPSQYAYTSMTTSGPSPIEPAVVTFPPAPVQAHVAVEVQAHPRVSFSSSVPASSELAPSVDLTPPPPPDPKAAVAAADAAAAARAAGKVNWKVLALILTGDLLGTGLLTVPHAYAQLGWVPATCAITALFLLTTYTGVRLYSLRTPGIASYTGLFHSHLGSSGRLYAAFCVHALLFLFVAGSLQVAQSSWRALFPNVCGAVWVAVVGVVAWIALQARSMPAIGVLGGVAVISATVPVVVVVGVLREDVLRGARAPGETSLWFGGGTGGEGGGAVVALMDLLFAFAGHAVFFEYVLPLGSSCGSRGVAVFGCIGRCCGVYWRGRCAGARSSREPTGADLTRLLFVVLPGVYFCFDPAPPVSLLQAHGGDGPACGLSQGSLRFPEYPLCGLHCCGRHRVRDRGCS